MQRHRPPSGTGRPPPTARTRSPCSRSRPRRGSRTWSRSATAGCWSRRSRSTAGRPCRWPPTSRPCRSAASTTQLCGDAHLRNFGLFASPERDLVFDINDFDETLPGPWEWDVLRLATSLVIAARSRGFTAHEGRHALHAAVRSYTARMHEYALDAGDRGLLREGRRDRASWPRSTRVPAPTSSTTIKSAAHHDALHEIPKLTEIDRRGTADRRSPADHHPPVRAHPQRSPRTALDRYRETLQEDRRVLLDRYTSSTPR